MKTKIIVKEVNPNVSWISDPDIVRRQLSYKKVDWIQGQYRKLRKQRIVSKVDKRGYFPTGLTQSVLKILKKKEIPYEHRKQDYGIEFFDKPQIVVGEKRGFQYKIIKEFLRNDFKRCSVESPTGSGKTIMAAWAAGSIKGTCIVFVHLQEIFQQMLETFTDAFGNDVDYINSEKKTETDKPIVIAMIQTFYRNLEKFSDEFLRGFALCIVDEEHHGHSLQGTYAKVIEKMCPPFRLGFTATFPREKAQALNCEALIGPRLKVIESEQQTLINKGYLSKPKMIVIKGPDKSYEEIRGYKQVYDKAVVQNRKRNRLIIKSAMKLIQKGLTVLVLIEKIDHGEELQRLFDMREEGLFIFLNGKCSNEQRLKEKKRFEDEKRKGVIATRIWTEGVNIKSVGAVINGAGGLSEKMVIQKFGRGLRTTDKKDSVYLVDIFDMSHPYLIKHSGVRLSLYFELGWLGGEL